MPKRRRRCEDSDEESDDDGSGDVSDAIRQKLEEAKELQRIRQRPIGVSAGRLAFGEEAKKEEDVDADPFKLKTGGLLDKAAAEKAKADQDSVRLDNTFAAETNIRDDDAAMMKYIDEEMKAKRESEDGKSKELTEYEKREKELFTIPEHLNVVSQKKVSEEMLSSQMLSGIPEVDLGVDEKLRNIEATEEARQTKLAQSKLKKHVTSDLVPKNVAANFSHRYFSGDNSEARKRREEAKAKANKPAPKVVPLVGGPMAEPRADIASAHALKIIDDRKYEEQKQSGTKNMRSQASDNYHYDKFVKRTRFR
ncbi:splicing factor C9orf78 homolog [Sycon ciliatum]|uniref:splicing factor C9orf78 homolog n=1 Tax=Sycon ciliatum TaxID=27933 RepID=UPI0020AC2776|eukprot:scpid76638/ scgid18580/ Uncharacterized protein C9orf78; Hepatocellular carcinoma-associated antigen 59